ncbi:MAG: hypothetical protein AB1394_10295 [Bacteroidota bacterium]
MSYKKTFIFGESLYVGQNIGGGDRAFLRLEFIINDEGIDETIFAKSVKLYWKEIGKTTINVDPSSNEYLVLPQEYSFKVIDSNDVLHELLYGENSEKVEKEFYVKFQVKYSGKLVYEDEFTGYNIPDLLSYDPPIKTHSIAACPQTNVLNETYLYPDGYDPEKWDPARNTSIVPNNPLDIGHERPEGNYIKWNWVFLQDVIRKIFQKINPDIEIIYNQDWEFLGSPNPEYGNWQIIQKGGIKFSELICDSNWIGAVFGGKCFPNINTIGDLLAQIAFDFGCIALIETQDRAYFREFYKFDENEVQEVKALADEGYKKSYRYKKIEFAEVKSVLFELYQKSLSVYKSKSFNAQETAFVPAAKKNKVSGSNGLQNQTISVIDTNAIFFPVNTYLFSNIKAFEPGQQNWVYSILGVNKPGFDVSSYPQHPRYQLNGIDYLPLNYLLSEYHYQLKGKLYNTQVHEHRFDGVNYQFTKGYYWDNEKFTIIGMEKDWDLRMTTMQSLRMGEVDKTIGDGQTEINEPPLLSLLSSGSYADYTTIFKVTKEDLNPTQQLSLIEVDAFTEVEELVVIIAKEGEVVFEEPNGKFWFEIDGEAIFPPSAVVNEAGAKSTLPWEEVFTERKVLKIKTDSQIVSGGFNVKIKYLRQIK